MIELRAEMSALRTLLMAIAPNALLNAGMNADRVAALCQALVDQVESIEVDGDERVLRQVKEAQAAAYRSLFGEIEDDLRAKAGAAEHAD